MATASHHGQNSLPAPGQLPSSMQNQIQSQMQGHQHPLLAKLTLANENSWLQIAALAETLGDSDKALNAAEAALRHNAYSLAALKMAGSLCRAKEMYPTAIDYFDRLLRIEADNGDIWGSLGHCYLMVEDLQKAYSAYQQALYHLANPKEPKLWYGIGILYDRYGSYEHAEEAFSAVIRMDPNFDKANEIYFRLGIIYKQQIKYEQSLHCFRYILPCPPKPLTETDIIFQIGLVQEARNDFDLARDAYERVLADNPNHGKVLQQLGWLFHSSQTTTVPNPDETAIRYLERSIEADRNDPLTWYLLGRCYMSLCKYDKAYENFDSAVHKDPRNSVFWCSIGVLYYQITQFIDALNAYKMAINCNRFVPEVWFNLGILYDSCKNQVQDAIDAYQMAHELEPHNQITKNRLNLLKEHQRRGGQLALPPPPSPIQPSPTDVPVGPPAAPAGAAVMGSSPNSAPFPPYRSSIPSQPSGSGGLGNPPGQPSQYPTQSNHEPSYRNEAHAPLQARKGSVQYASSGKSPAFTPAEAPRSPSVLERHPSHPTYKQNRPNASTLNREPLPLNESASPSTTSTQALPSPTTHTYTHTYTHTHTHTPLPFSLPTRPTTETPDSYPPPPPAYQGPTPALSLSHQHLNPPPYDPSRGEKRRESFDDDNDTDQNSLDESRGLQNGIGERKKQKVNE